MNLPPELIYEVICNLASDVQSLRSCSLVAKSWAHPSRKWIFKDVSVSGDTHQRWLDRISPGDVELLRNVRSFRYTSDSKVWVGVTLYRIDSLQHYLPSLCCLESLGLSSMSLVPDAPGQVGLFSAFQHTLSSLSITCCHTTSSALITIVSYFPLLSNLRLQSLLFAPGGESAPPLSRPLRGRLAIAECNINARALFDKLSDPPPELDELALCRVDMPSFYDAILGAHGGSVKRLKMISNIHWRKLRFPTLSHCRGLRELEISLPALIQDEVSLFLSITSTDLQKIVLPARYRFKRRDDPVFARYYQTIDDCLCQLIGRLQGLGYKHKLEIVFRIWEVPGDEDVFKGLLPKFREQGRVKFTWWKDERVIYCSDL